MGTSIARVGFLGANNQKLWCLTHIETIRYVMVITNSQPFLEALCSMTFLIVSSYLG